MAARLTGGVLPYIFRRLLLGGQILLRLTGSSLQPVYQDMPGTVAATTKATLGYRPTKAKQLLGWEAQVGIEDGIRRLIAWAEGRSTL